MVSTGATTANLFAPILADYQVALRSNRLCLVDGTALPVPSGLVGTMAASSLYSALTDGIGLGTMNPCDVPVLFRDDSNSTPRAYIFSKQGIDYTVYARLDNLTGSSRALIRRNVTSPRLISANQGTVTIEIDEWDAPSE